MPVPLLSTVLSLRAAYRKDQRLRRPVARTSGGDVDAAWQDSDVGEESVGGGNPTPDQSIVEELGEAMGVTYEDNEPLDFLEKLVQRDRDRRELDPASAEDFGDTE